MLAFGLNVALLIFRKITKPVVSKLRKEGYRSVIYLDEIFIIGASDFECNQNTQTTIRLLEELGFIINRGKSNLLSCTRGKFLGVIYDS